MGEAENIYFTCLKAMIVVTQTTAALRRRVLSSYKQLLTLGKTWQAEDPRNTADERKYIIEETKTQFRRNVTLEGEAAIEELLRELEARLEMAKHYRNPFPRAINLPPMGLVASLGKNRSLKGQKKLREQSVPIYIRSSNELDS